MTKLYWVEAYLVNKNGAPIYAHGQQILITLATFVERHKGELIAYLGRTWKVTLTWPA